MAIDISRSDEQQRLVITISDPWSVEDIAVALDRQAANATWKYGTLYDLRATAWVPSEPDVLWLVKRGEQAVALHGARGPVAVVLGSRKESSAQQTYAQHAGSKGRVRIAVFTDVDAAHAWLDANRVT